MRANNSVHRQAVVLLEVLDGGLRLGSENPVHGESQVGRTGAARITLVARARLWLLGQLWAAPSLALGSPVDDAPGQVSP